MTLHPQPGKTLTRWECDTCGRVGLLNDPSRGWHIDGWHVSARPASECMIGPGKADTRCFGIPVERTYAEVTHA